MRKRIMTCTPPPAWGEGVKILEKYLLRGQKFLLWWGGGSNFIGGSRNFEGEFKIV